jgi:hypothetical protein
MDGRGQIVIAPRYRGARDFGEGLALIWTEEGPGFIDEKGRVVFMLASAGQPFDWSRSFSGGRAWFSVGRRCGCVNREGLVVVKPQFDDCGDFSSGLARVKVGGTEEDAFGRRFGGKWGYVDTAGRMVIEPQFDIARDFSDGLAGVRIAKRFIYIDTAGRPVLRLNYKWRDPKRTIASAGMFREGLACIATSTDGGPELGFVDKEGRLAIDPQFNAARDFSEGLAAVRINNKWGFVDRAGRLSIPLRFDEAGRFSEGLAWVRIGDATGYIDKRGGLAIWPGKSRCAARVQARTPGPLNDAEDFRGGLARVHAGGAFEHIVDGPGRWKGGAWYYVSSTGEIVRRCRLDEENWPAYGREYR